MLRVHANDKKQESTAPGGSLVELSVVEALISILETLEVRSWVILDAGTLAI